MTDPAPTPTSIPQELIELEPCPWCEGRTKRFQMKTTDGEIVEMVEHHGWPHCCVRRDSMTLAQWNTRPLTTNQTRLAELEEALREARLAVAADLEEAECGDDGRSASFIPVFAERLAKIDAVLGVQSSTPGADLKGDQGR